MIIIIHLISLKMFDIATWIIDYCLFRYCFQSDASVVVMVNLWKQNTFYLLPMTFLKHRFWDSPFCLITDELQGSSAIKILNIDPSREKYVPRTSWGRPKKTSYGCPHVVVYIMLRAFSTDVLRGSYTKGRPLRTSWGRLLQTLKGCQHIV